MASRHEASEVFLFEDIIYVALGTDVRECKSILLWAVQNSGGKRICILHVHQPPQLIPFMGTRAPASKLKESIVREYREKERQKMQKTLDDYLLICRQMGVQAKKVYTEMDCIKEGIVDLISQHDIKKLVMGAAAEKQYKKKMMELRSTKAMYVREKAPVSCQIQFICKGNLIHTRQSRADTETGEANPLRSRSVTFSQNRDITEPGPANYYRSQSVTLGHNRDIHGRNILFPQGMEELPSLKNKFDAEESSDEWDGSSRRSTSVYSTRSPKRVVDVTLTSWSEGNEFSTLSPPTYYSRSPSTVEAASSLWQPSSSSLSTSSSNGALSAADGSLDNTLYEQYQQAAEEADKETQRRRKAERDLVEALRRAQEESFQRKEIEEALLKGKEEVEKVKNQRDQLMEEFRNSHEQIILLKSQLENLQKERDEFKMERDNALKEAEELRRKQAEASRHLPQFFSEYSLSEIEEATHGFDESLKIGQGGYGSIYKGRLHQTKVAIKRLESQGSQGPSEFRMEVRVLSHLRHPNLVRLIGSCPEVFALIYEYLPCGSLEDRLNCKDNSPPLSWQTRICIATELCSVLVYLHCIKPHSIVHGDLKPSNVLLDSNFVCKLSDFGICRMLCHDKSSSNTTLCHFTDPKGTIPYIDPEFVDTGKLTRKSDVYSFGIILIQLLTGRSAIKLANAVQNALDARNLKTVLDPSAGDWPFELAQELARLALRCCDKNRKNRPDLGSDVRNVLEQMRASCGASSLYRQEPE
uniref:RING-type E3 ubiquitin transferase n=1 Tax=Quercus lobata TaxID=97700 RepID=A0A7N2MF47_QUELO